MNIRLCNLMSRTDETHVIWNSLKLVNVDADSMQVFVISKVGIMISTEVNVKN